MVKGSAAEKMDIVVIGPGAIGCLFGSLLGLRGNNVTVVDHNVERAARIERNGITLEWNDHTHIVPVCVQLNPRTFSFQADVILLCVKSYDNEQAAISALPFIGPETLVVSLQNGIGNIERLASSTAHEKTAALITSMGATLLGDGHVRYAGKGATYVTAEGQLKPRGEALASELSRCGVPAEWNDNTDAVIWSKAVINAAINPVTAISGVCNGDILLHPDLTDLMSSAAKEAQSVAEAEGITLLYDDAAEEAAQVCRNTHSNISSMLQDIRNETPTEIDAITGMIVTSAKASGVPVPVNESLLKQVKQRSGFDPSVLQR